MTAASVLDNFSLPGHVCPGPPRVVIFVPRHLAITTRTRCLPGAVPGQDGGPPYCITLGSIHEEAKNFLWVWMGNCFRLPKCIFDNLKRFIVIPIPERRIKCVVYLRSISPVCVGTHPR